MERSVPREKGEESDARFSLTVFTFPQKGGIFVSISSKRSYFFSSVIKILSFFLYKALDWIAVKRKKRDEEGKLVRARLCKRIIMYVPPPFHP